jgi:gas vesicle protein
MNKGLEFAVVFAIGTLAGGLAAALTTPVSGRRARRLLRKKVDQGATQLERGIERSKREVRGQLANVAAMAR